MCLMGMIILPFFLLHIYLGKREKGFKIESLKILNIICLIIVFCANNELSTERVKYINLILTLKGSYSLSFRFFK